MLDLFDETFRQQSRSHKSDPLLVHVRQELFACRINESDAAQVNENGFWRFRRCRCLPTPLQFADASTRELSLNDEASHP
jgi:hypothetical protein